MDKARGPRSLQSPTPDAGSLTGRFSPQRCRRGAQAGHTVRAVAAAQGRGWSARRVACAQTAKGRGISPCPGHSPSQALCSWLICRSSKWQQPLPRWPPRSVSVKRALCTRACVEAGHVAWGSSLTKPALVRAVPSPVAVPWHPSQCSLASGAACSPGQVGGRAVVPRLPRLGPPPARGLAMSD